MLSEKSMKKLAKRATKRNNKCLLLVYGKCSKACYFKCNKGIYRVLLDRYSNTVISSSYDKYLNI